MRASVATIGVFDGVHIGHQFLLRRTVEEAGAIDGQVVAFTFDPHPATVLAPSRAPLLLTPTIEKLPLLERAGAGETVVIGFDEAVSLRTPEEFIDEYLLAGRRLSHLVIGHDFALGRNRAGDAARLAEIGRDRGFLVTRVPALRHDGIVVSSTVIRDLVHRGDLDRAGSLLGRPYAVVGPVVEGEGRGRQLGFPTANLDLPAGKLMPPFGVYAVRVTLDPRTSGGAVHPGVMNFGNRPTFGGTFPSAEVHLINFHGTLVGRILEVELVAGIRPEQKFSGAMALATRIALDVAEARRLLGID